MTRATKLLVGNLNHFAPDLLLLQMQGKGKVPPHFTTTNVSFQKEDSTLMGVVKVVEPCGLIDRPKSCKNETAIKAQLLTK
jgi:hypothetical protein